MSFPNKRRGGGKAFYEFSSGRGGIYATILLRFSFMRVFGLLISITVLLGAFMLLVSRAVMPILIDAERQQLVSLMPLVRGFIVYAPEGMTLDDQIRKLNRLSGFDVTLLDANNLMLQTTLASGDLKGKKLDVGARDQTIFELVDIEGEPSFVLSTPLRPPDRFGASLPLDLRLALSHRDTAVGAFYDDLLTSSLIMELLGIALSVALGFYFRRRPVSDIRWRPIADAFNALARKDFKYRMGEEVGGPAFAPSRIAFNKFMENAAKEAASISATPRNVFPSSSAPTASPVAPPATPVLTENIVRSRLVSGESERRAFQTALGSVEEGVLIVDHLGRIIVFNRRMEELSLFDADVVANKVLTDVVTLTKRGGGDVTSLIPRIISTGITEVFPEDTLLRRRDGTSVPVSVRTVVIKNDLRGAVAYAVVIITDRKPTGSSIPVIEIPPPALLKKTFVPQAPAETMTAEKAAQSPPAVTVVSKPAVVLPSIIAPVSQTKSAPPPSYPPHSDSEKLPSRMVDTPNIVKEHFREAVPLASPVISAEAVSNKSGALPKTDAKTTHRDSEKLPVITREELPALRQDNLPAVPPNPSVSKAKDASAPPPNLPI